MTLEAECQVSIGRSPEQAFAFVADGLRWRPGILDIARVYGSGLGAVGRQGVRGPGGHRVAATEQLEAGPAA